MTDVSTDGLDTAFWAKVGGGRTIEPEGCWIWNGSRNAKGYGQFYFKGRRYTATHVALFLNFGEWPPRGQLVCHRCDNPPCVRPSHLFIGSPAENTADAILKGRLAKGERHGSAKLTNDQVRAIRSSPNSQRTIAREFGIGQSVVCEIRQGKAWTHVGGAA